MALGSVKVSARHRADNSAARVLPVATTLLAVLISIQPVAIPGYTALTPAFTLMAVYHWTIYRPHLLPPVVLFLIVLAQELLTVAPPGTTSMMLLLARVCLLPRRRYFVDPPF